MLRAIKGRLKMREWKMRYGQKSKGGKCGSEKIGSRSQGWKMQEQTSRMESRTDIIQRYGLKVLP